MPNHSTPGVDGFPTEFFNVFAGVNSETEDPTTKIKTASPNPFAALLGQAFREMLTAGSMSPNMRRGGISII